jgi:hypothetical protein
MYWDRHAVDVGLLEGTVPGKSGHHRHPHILHIGRDASAAGEDRFPSHVFTTVGTRLDDTPLEDNGVVAGSRDGIRGTLVVEVELTSSSDMVTPPRAPPTGQGH